MVISQYCLSSGATVRVSHSASGMSCGGPENARQTLYTAYRCLSRSEASSGGKFLRSMYSAAAALKSACAKSPVNVVPAGRSPALPLTRITGWFSIAVAAQPVRRRTSSAASPMYQRETSSWS